MVPRKSFLLRLPPELLARLQRWADDDLRSLNGQIEFLLRKALQESGRGKHPESTDEAPHDDRPAPDQPPPDQA